MKRRALLMAAASIPLAQRAAALGRVPVGGKLQLRVPWSTSSLDPHDLHDPLAAIFGGAMAETLYAIDAGGTVHPALADGMPSVEKEQTVVRLRPNLRTAYGKALGGRDVAWSTMRARKRGAIGLLGALEPWINSDDKAPLIARFGKVDPDKLALMLTSPLTALLPVGFDPQQPDGCGAFKATCSSSALSLSRNDNASRGPSFLERVTVLRADDLSDSLRAFESGQDDIGWLGMGFHGTRPKSRKFDYRDVGWVVLAAGDAAGAFAAPGMAQQLADAVPVERLGLGLGARPGAGAGAAWRGGAASLLFDAGAGHLAAIAEAVAAKLSSPGHRLVASGVSRSQLRSARSSRSFALALDVVRHPGAGPTGSFIALATADSPSLGEEMATKPPRAAWLGPAHVLARTLRIGVLGGLAVQGGVVEGTLVAPNKDGRGIDWGGSYRGW
jgi:peptide/nickel transport system substrate-binding protein